MTQFRASDLTVVRGRTVTATGMIIAIDGPAASGKGTLGRRLADRLGYAFLDTGALYRAVGVRALAAGGDPARESDALRAAGEFCRNFTPEELESPELRTAEASDASSKVAAIEGVRAALLDFQRDFAQNPPDLADGRKAGGAVLDGRDIGTVVCPDADIKLFVRASAEIRAERRCKELQQRGIDVKYSAVLEEMRLRDERDSTRKVAPLVPAKDAFVLDTSGLGIAEVLDQALTLVRAKLIADSSSE